MPGWMHGNPDLCDLSPLASCPGLTALSAVDTSVSDLSPLAGHPGLKEIVLSGTPVKDVSPLAAIPALEMVWLYGTEVEDVSCLAALPGLRDLNLRKTKVADLSAFRGREGILGIERSRLGIRKAGKSAGEIRKAIEEVRERLDSLGVMPRPVLKRDAISAFEEKNGVKLPKEYVSFLTQVGDGLEVQLRSFVYRFPPLAELKFDPECIGKRFSHREGWCWEDDDNAAGRKIAAATRNGQIELVDCGCGRSFRLIVCGGAGAGMGHGGCGDRPIWQWPGFPGLDEGLSGWKSDLSMGRYADERRDAPDLYAGQCGKKCDGGKERICMPIGRVCQFCKVPLCPGKDLFGGKGPGGVQPSGMVCGVHKEGRK